MSSFDRRSVLILAAALTGCGFTPAYGPEGGARPLQGRIGFAKPGSRRSYLFVQRMEERVGRANDPAYKMTYDIDTSKDGLGSTRDGKTTRYHVNGTVRYTLTDTATGKTVSRGTERNFTAYSATGTTASTQTAERDATERLMTILADQVMDRLLLDAQRITG